MCALSCKKNPIQIGVVLFELLRLKYMLVSQDFCHIWRSTLKPCDLHFFGVINEHGSSPMKVTIPSVFHQMQ